MVTIIKGLGLQSELMKWSHAVYDGVKFIQEGFLAQNER